MRYNDFKKYFINNIYSNYMQGDIGMARTSIARIYRDGKDNPRATIYRTYSCLNETYNLYKTQKNLYIISSKRAMAIEHQEKYLKFRKRRYYAGTCNGKATVRRIVHKFKNNISIF